MKSKKKILSDNDFFNLGLIFVAIVTIYRLYFLHSSDLSLYPDEAQYWFWSKHFDFGYYSKPPMIAWFIKLFSSPCGDKEFCIRYPSVLLHTTTSIIIYFIAKELYSPKIALWSMLTYITLPSVSFSATIMSTDPILLFFWSTSLYFFIKSLKTRHLIYYILTGITAGLGCMTKFNMIIFLISALFYFHSNKDNLAKILKDYRIWLTIIIAFLIYLPNLLWNYNNGFVSYLHTKDISGVNEKKLINILGFLEFYFGQFLIAGPIIYWFFLTAIAKFKNQEDERLVFTFSLTFLTIIFFVSLLGKAYINWAAPAYVAITIYAVKYIIENSNVKWLKLSLFLHIILALSFYNYENIFANSIKFDPFSKTRYYKELAELVTSEAKKNEAYITSDERKLIAELLYYTKNNNFHYRKYNLDKTVIKDHFDLTMKISNHDITKNFVFVSSRTLHPEEIILFKEAEYIGNISNYNIYVLKEFKGLK